jgi:hypothetical protein
MNRYQLAVRKHRRDFVIFPPTRSIGAAIKYIEYCMRMQLGLILNNVAPSVRNAAVISYSKRCALPILTETQLDAMSLSAAYSYNRVYCLENLPKEAVGFIVYSPDIISLKPPLKAFLYVLYSEKYTVE